MEFINERVSNKIRKFEENREINLEKIKKKFKSRINSSVQHVESNLIKNENEDRLYLEELKQKPLKRYEQRVIIILIYLSTLIYKKEDLLMN